ncbi:10972_t:CDS:2, partial [Gigaspora rosea]
YDSPLMLNQRTSESCGAVQAGHTVSTLEDIAPNISEPISSPSTEILLSNPNNLVLTYSNDKLLPDNNASTSNTISSSLDAGVPATLGPAVVLALDAGVPTTLGPAVVLVLDAEFRQY